MAQGLSCKAYSRSAGQDIPAIVPCPPLEFSLHQIINIILPYTRRSPKWSNFLRS